MTECPRLLDREKQVCWRALLAGVFVIFDRVKREYLSSMMAAVDA
jgi:hypothetical protein